MTRHHVLAILVFSIAAPLAEAQPVQSRVVAYTGGPVPGVPGARFNPLSGITMGSNGDLAWYAEYPSFGVPFQQGAEGIWVERAGVASLYKREGDPSPLADHKFLIFSVPLINIFGQVSFNPRLQHVSAAGDALYSLVAETSSGLRLVAYQGMSPPALGGKTFGSIHAFYANDVGQTAFQAKVSGGLADESFFDNGSDIFWLRSPGPNFPSVFLVGLSADGRVTVMQRRAGDDATVWQSNAGGPLQPIAVTRQRIAGLADAEELKSIHTVRTNTTGHIAFSGAIGQENAFGFQTVGFGFWIAPPGGAPALISRASGIQNECAAWFLSDKNRLLCMGQTGNESLNFLDAGGVVRILRKGDTAPGIPGAVFDFFESPSMNGHEQLAFIAGISGPGVTTANNRGLWVQDGSFNWHLVARNGDSVEVASGDVRTIGIRRIIFGAGNDGGWRGFSDRGDLLWIPRTTDVDPTDVYMVTNVGVPVQEPKLIGLEAVQVVQDWTNSVPLVSGKRTVVRAHVENPTPMRFVGRLRGYRGGVELPQSPLVSRTPGAYVNIGPNAASKRGILQQSSYFELPPEWAQGTIDLKVEWVSGDLLCEEAAGPAPDDCRATVTFQPVAKPEVRFVSVFWNDDGVRREIDETRRQDLADRLISIFPISDLDVDGANYQWSGETPPKIPEVLVNMRRLRARDCQQGCRRIFYGAVLNDDIAGLAGTPGTAGAGYVPLNAHTLGRHTHSHEIGHNLGRFHAVEGAVNAEGKKLGKCSEDAPGVAPDFPYFHNIGGRVRPTLGPMDQGEDRMVFGLDTSPMQVVDPNKFFELMSWCSEHPIDAWPSSYTYAALLTEINARFGPPPSKLTAGATEDYLLVSGLVDVQSGSVALLPLEKLAAAIAPQNPPAGNYLLRLRDAAGAIVNELSFQPEHDEQRTVLPPSASFLLSLPANPTARRIEILRDGSMVTSRDASATPPTLTITSPNGGEVISGESTTISWQATDAEGDPLTYVVEFSPDGGTSWSTLTIGWPQQSLQVRRDQLRATTAGVIRVYVSDGFHVSSDVSNAAFTVLNNAPGVTLKSPADGSLHAGDQLVFFEGYSRDPEDGRLSASSFTWTSSIDGSLGTRNGFALKASTLSEGEHTITATATDAQGTQSTATAIIRVVRSQTAPLSDLTATIVSANRVAEGAMAAYQVTAANNGPETVAQATLTFSAMHEVSGSAPIVGVEAPSGWSCSTTNEVVTCTADQIAANTAVTFAIRVGPSTLGTLRATAQVSTAAVDPALANNTASAETRVVPAVSGDVNGDASVSVADVFYLVNHFFLGGPAPIGRADVNGDSVVSAADIIYLIAYLFAGGPQPQ